MKKYYPLIALFTVLIFSFTAEISAQCTNNPQIELQDKDTISPFNNCDNSPSLSNPNYTIELENATQDTALIDHYEIDWGDGNTDSLGNSGFPVTHQYNSLGLFNLTFKAIDTTGCQWDTTYSVANQSNPAIGISSLGSTQGCSPQTFKFVMEQYQNNSPGTYYVWDFGDGSSKVTWNYDQPFINDTISHTFDTTSCLNPSGAFTVEVTAYNTCDNTTASVGNIKIYESPQVSFQPAQDTICTGDSLQFINNTVAGFGYNCNSIANYVWNFGDSLSSQNTSTLEEPSHVYQQPGTYNIVLEADNGVCTPEKDTSEVVVVESADVSVSADTNEICKGSAITFTNFSTGTSMAYNWSVSPSSGVNILSGSLQDSNLVVEFMDAGQYQVKLEASNYCSIKDTSITIDVNDKPEVAIDSISNYCENAAFKPSAQFNPNGTSINSYNWDFPGANPSSSNSQTPSQIQYDSTGTYQVNLEASNACGTAKDSLSFTIHSLPTPTATISKNTICYGDSVTLSAQGGYSFTWSPATTVMQPDSTTTKAIPTSSQVYTVEATDQNGCKNVDSASLHVNPNPNIQMTTFPDSICPGDTSLITASGASSFSFQSPASLTSNTSNSVYVTDTADAPVYVTGQDSNGCSTTDTTMVNVREKPQLDITPSNPEICLNDSIHISVNGADSYEWYHNGNLITTQNFIDTSLQNNTTFVIKGMDKWGCEVTDSVFIKVHDLPTTSIGSHSDTLCEGGSTTLKATGANSYFWQSTGKLSSSTNSQITATPDSSAKYYVTGTDTNGCSSQDSTSITVKLQPALSVSPDTTALCKGDSVKLKASGPFSKKWSSSNGTNHTGDSINVSPDSTTSYKITTTGNNGCKNSDTAKVNVLPLPDISFTPQSPEICYGDTVDLQFSNAHSFSIDPSKGLSDTTGSSIQAYPDTTTDYHLTGYHNNGCSVDTNLSVNVIPKPQIDIQPSDTSICQGQSVALIGSGAQSYYWTPGNSLNASTNDTVVATPMSTTTYYLVGTSVNGCEAKDSITIDVSQGSQLSAASTYYNICEEDTINLSVNGALTYDWGNKSSIVQTNGNQATVSPNSNTTYQVIGTDSANCMHTINITVDVMPSPVVTASASSTSICKNDSVDLHGSGAQNYQWFDNGTSISSQQDFTDVPQNATKYKVIGTDTNGCMNSDEININVNSLPSLNLSVSDSTICQGNSTNITASGADNYYWTPDSSLNKSNSKSVTATADTTTYYKVTGISSKGCQTQDSILLTVYPSPDVKLNSNKNNICFGDSVTLSASGADNYQWNHSQNSSDTITIQPDSTFDYKVTGSTNMGCASEATQKVTVNPLPNVDFETDSILCQNNSFTINNKTSNATTFNWDFGDNTTSNASNPSHSYQNSKYYTIKLEASSSNGCVDSTSQSVQVIGQPVADFTSTPDSGCAPLSVQYNNQSTGNYVNYNWDLGNGTSNNSKNPGQVIYQGKNNSDTNYVVSLTTSNKCGTDTREDTIKVKTSPEASFGISPHNGCSPLSVQLANNTTGNPQNFHWDFGDGNTSNSANPGNHSFTYNGNSDTTYQVQLIAFNQCSSDTLTKQVTVNPKSVNAFFSLSKNNGCAPLTVNFNNYSTPGANVLWDFDDGNISSQSNPTHTFTSAGNYSVKLIVNDSCSTDTISKSITVNMPPVSDFSMSQDTICNGAQVDFTNLTANSANIQWDFDDGQTSSLTNPTHTFNQAGVHEIKMVIQEQGTFCKDSTIKQLYVQPTPEADFATSTMAGCQPLNINVFDSSKAANYYHYTFGNGNSSNQAAPTNVYNQDGTYKIWQKVENIYGCQDSTQQEITVHPKPVSDFSLPYTVACDTPASVQPNNLSTGAIDYEWNLDNGQFSTQQNPTIDYTTTGKYDIKLIASNMYQCNDTSSKKFTVSEPVNPKFTLDKVEGCEPLTVSFSDSSQNSIKANWEFGDNQLGSNKNTTHIYQTDGTYSVKLLAENKYGCKDSVLYKDTIRVYPKPFVDFDYKFSDEPHSNTGKVEFSAKSPNAKSWFWDFDDGDTETSENPEHHFPAMGVYNVYLNVSNKYGCKNDTTKSINMDAVKSLYIPNALAPEDNSKGVSQFKPKGKGLKEYSIALFDRWGNKIWSSTKLDNGQPAEAWDGTKDGELLPAGVYVWKVEAVFEDGSAWKGKKGDDGRYRTKGQVTLIR